ncbi:MAG: hypothetical protein F6J98_27740 [Moorea sp. SIO4G2]|nr:hypothetical protein [Moorena sp. SIO4G2]
MLHQQNLSRNSWKTVKHLGVSGQRSAVSGQRSAVSGQRSAKINPA